LAVWGKPVLTNKKKRETRETSSLGGRLHETNAREGGNRAEARPERIRYHIPSLLFLKQKVGAFLMHMSSGQRHFLLTELNQGLRQERILWLMRLLRGFQLWYFR